MCDTEKETTAGSERSPVPLVRGERSFALVARFTDHCDGRRECTLYPRGASGVDLMSSWITADEGSYVPLDETR
jgi:hypothetical protein